MPLIMVGLSHKTAPLELREALALEGQKLSDAYSALLGKGVSELVLLSTCNRVEAYAGCDDADAAEKRLRHFFEGLRPEKAAAVRKALVGFGEEHALWHLLKVSCSLDSMVLGEAQVLGQVKEAYRLAVEHEAVGRRFHGLFQRAFAAAKDVRTNTDLGRHPASIPSVAVNLAERLFGDLKGRTGLLVGAGDMAELTAEHFKAAGVSRLIICNRSQPRAKELARRFGGEARGLEELESSLREADLAVFSASSPQPLLGLKAAQAVLAAREGRPQLLLDIAVPRNVDAEVKKLEPAYLYNLDDLSAMAEEHREKRLEAGREAEAILKKRYEDIREWVSADRVGPAIAALTLRIEELRKFEMEKHAAKLKHLGPEDLEKVDYLTQALVKKILNTPIARLKDSLKSGKASIHVESLESLFGLKDPD